MKVAGARGGLDEARIAAVGGRLASRISPWTAVVVLAMVAYAVYFSLYATLLHLTFRTTNYDLGTVDQGIWLAGRKSDLFVTVRGLPLLGDHVRPIAFVLAPIYWIWDDVCMLLIVQTVAIAAGAAFLFLIARRELPESPALVAAIAIGYLLNPFVQNLNLDHVHPDAFASTFLLASVYFLRTEHYVAFWVAAALAMACKEDVPLVYVVLGLMLLGGRERRLGLVLAAVAGLYFAACVGWILPHFNGVGFFRAGRFVPQSRHHGFVSALFTRLVNTESGAYLFALGLPVGFSALLAPVTLAPGLPQVAANLLSAVGYARRPIYHYATSIVPFLYLATIDVMRKLVRWRSNTVAEFANTADGGAAAFLPSRRGAYLALFLLACVVAANIEYSRVPLNGLARIRGLWRSYTSDSSQDEIRAVMRRIPPDAAVSADHTLVPHLSHRHRIYMFPNPFRTELWGVRGERPHNPDVIDYIIVRPAVAPEKQAVIIDSLVANGIFVRIGNEQAVRLYERVRTPSAAGTAPDVRTDNSKQPRPRGDGAAQP